MKQHIPNIFTCGNLFCGCVGIVAVFQNDLNLAAYMIGLAAVLDFGDGFAARILKSHSAIGKELDSLADCVTFGALPGMILFKLLKNSLMNDRYEMDLYMTLPYLAFLITVFSALRLAKFNVDTRQTDSFIGVPTPANALFVGSIPLILWQHPAWSPYILNPIGLVIYILGMSFLMTSEIPLFALKFKDFSIENNKVRYLFLALSLGLIIFLQFAALPVIIVLYILLSLIRF